MSRNNKQKRDKKAAKKREQVKTNKAAVKELNKAAMAQIPDKRTHLELLPTQRPAEYDGSKLQLPKFDETKQYGLWVSLKAIEKTDRVSKMFGYILGMIPPTHQSLVSIIHRFGRLKDGSLEQTLGWKYAMPVKEDEVLVEEKYLIEAARQLGIDGDKYTDECIEMAIKMQDEAAGLATTRRSKIKILDGSGGVHNAVRVDESEQSGKIPEAVAEAANAD